MCSSRVYDAARDARALAYNGFLQITVLLNIIAVHSGDYNASMGVGTSISVKYSIGAEPTVLLHSPSSGYVLSLDCSNATITVANQMAEQSSPVLVWLPTYFNVSYSRPVTDYATCTLKLEEEGDLVLSLQSEDQASSTLVWISGTKGQDVQTLELQDSGNLVLLNSRNGTVWQSFDYPTNILLWGQKLKKGMSLVAADATGFRSGGTYMMVLEDNDLRLYAVSNRDDNKTLFWSLKNSAGSTHTNLEKADYAALFQGGVAVFAEDDSVVLSSQSQSSKTSYSSQYGVLSADADFQVYLLVEGQYWVANYAALVSDCQNPNACGRYGICSNNKSQSDVVSCTCPPSFSRINSSDPSQGCAYAQGMSSFCGDDMELMQVAGQHYDYFSVGFSSPLNVSSDQCTQSCLRNCSCLAVFVDSSSSNSCFLILNEVLTIMQTSSSTQNLFLKVFANTTNQISPSMEVPPLRNSHGISKGVLVATVVSGMALACVVALGILWAKRKARMQHYKKLLGSLPGLPPRYSYKDLHIATNGFSQHIGKGGFGSVFAGTFGDSTRVAVKRLEGGDQGEKQFEAEVAAIGSIDHVNLVRILGFCMEGERHRLLVYEFMEGGSLDGHLAKESESVLPWELRYCIALDVARGLAYLHEGTRRKIVHFDVKSANILLDARMRARISDLGLCKIMGGELQSQVVTCMRGTRGYLAPEWLLNMPVNEKSDVYSYGVVLLELLSGRRVMDVDGEGGESIRSWAGSMPSAMYMTHLLDVRMLQNAAGNGLLPEESEVYRLVQVALWCTEEVAASRPAMSHVLKILQGDLDLPPERKAPELSAPIH